MTIKLEDLRVRESELDWYLTFLLGKVGCSQERCRAARKLATVRRQMAKETLRIIAAEERRARKVEEIRIRQARLMKKAKTPTGRIRRFRTLEAAQKAAVTMNRTNH